MIAVDSRHQHWLGLVSQRVGLKELDPQPYWGFEDLCHKAGTKLLNCFYVQAETEKENEQEFFRYSRILILRRFSIDRLLSGIEQGYTYIDFDARTGHNHGTKFRLRPVRFPLLYDEKMEI